MARIKRFPTKELGVEHKAISSKPRLVTTLEEDHPVWTSGDVQAYDGALLRVRPPESAEPVLKALKGITAGLRVEHRRIALTAPKPTMKVDFHPEQPRSSYREIVETIYTVCNKKIKTRIETYLSKAEL